jgi:hypothetical protein
MASNDALGPPIMARGIKFYRRGQIPQVYQTIGGPISVERPVDQPSMGGRTFVPLENKANLDLNSTPLFAKVVLSQMANRPSTKAMIGVISLIDNAGARLIQSRKFSLAKKGSLGMSPNHFFFNAVTKATSARGLRIYASTQSLLTLSSVSRVQRSFSSQRSSSYSYSHSPGLGLFRATQAFNDLTSTFGAIRDLNPSRRVSRR